MKHTVIAIDGHSSCGKSTVAKTLAKHLGYIYVDTGAMYRAVTYYCLQNNLISQNGIINEVELEKRIADINISFKNSGNGYDNQQTYLNGENIEEKIRGLEVSTFVSPISKIKFVREYLVNLQRALGESQNLVMDGRDIGTVVYPHAKFKFFMTASPEIRAQRRYDELQAKGETISYDEILHNLIDRDNQDSTRKESPLKKAEDAIVLDNSNLSREEQLQWIINTVKSS